MTFFEQMSLDKRCREQIRVADELGRQWRYARAGSDQQVSALKVLYFLVSCWPMWLKNETKRMDKALKLIGN